MVFNQLYRLELSRYGSVTQAALRAMVATFRRSACEQAAM
jgi:hypothetical protein